jgi:Tetrahydrofolate dehydrogenase/cyclohydrolase, NAD(P)-binding domain
MQADDRPGLLNCIAAALNELQLDAGYAHVASDSAKRVHDRFTITDGGAPARDAAKLQRLPGLVRAHAEGAARDSVHLAALTRTADIVVVAVGFPELVRCAARCAGTPCASAASFHPAASDRNCREFRRARGAVRCVMQTWTCACRADWVKKGAVVIDVGINVVPQVRQAGALAGAAPVAGAAAIPTVRIVGDVAYSELQGVASALTPVPGGVGPMTIGALVHNVVLAARYSAGMPWVPNATLC